MAVAVAVNDIVQVTPRFVIEGQQTENVLYFRCVNVDDDMLAHLLLVIGTCIITHLLPGLSANCELESVKGKIVGPAVGADAEYVPASGAVVAGAASGDAEPSFVAAVVSLRTANGTRSGHGRMFIGGIPEVGTTGSLLNIEGPTWAAIAAFIACVAAAFPKHELGGSASYEWGIYSRKLGGATKPPYPEVGFIPLTGTIMRRELGTQRSRKLGRGK